MIRRTLSIVVFVLVLLTQTITANAVTCTISTKCNAGAKGDFLYSREISLTIIGADSCSCTGGSSYIMCAGVWYNNNGMDSYTEYYYASCAEAIYIW